MTREEMTIKRRELALAEARLALEKQIHEDHLKLAYARLQAESGRSFGFTPNPKDPKTND